MQTINISFDSLFDVLRNEKKNEELQDLDRTFYIDVVSYIREKQRLLEGQIDEDELFAASERKKLEAEMQSIKRIIKEIYEKREKKIISIALNKSRTRSDIIDTSSMLPEEKEFFNKLVKHFDSYRRGILLQLWKGELPLVQSGSTTLRDDVLEKTAMASLGSSEEESNISSNALEELKNKVLSESAKESISSELGNNEDNESGEESEDDFSDEQYNDNVSEIEEETFEHSFANADLESDSEETDYDDLNPKIVEETFDEEDLDESNVEDELVKVKILHPVPKFIWKDMKEYGPFNSGEETEFYPEIADLLEKKGRAEKV